ncbi:hypothetical protein FJR48_07590 [Sulfurimonas lithotrophica]|uniref:DUF493 domain-containing protein n=1 Tax=Sulfurimonas lithotrophica TaxID=2590022 RepID=A0A5P8P1Q5_9BACT|nr:hypothetical protein [Sulfurimonas lithotrophica]QFR49604.1 hypothetical protein FJR48_07590 [Sulfurimonas lithotrophica]
MIDAEFRSEERFSRLTLAYTDAEEKEKVNKCVDKIIATYKMKPEMHTTATSSGKEVLVIEYHDDLDRTSGAIFEKIMKELDIKNCD